MIQEDNLGDTNFTYHFIKWTASFWGTAKWGRRPEAFIGLKK